MGIAVRHVRDSVADGRQESQGRNPAVGGDTPRLSARFGLSHKYPLRGKLAAGQGIHGSTHSRLPSIPKYAHSFTLGRRALSMETSCGEGLETFDALCSSSFYFDGLAPAWIRRHTLCSYEDRHSRQDGIMKPQRKSGTGDRRELRNRARGRKHLCPERRKAGQRRQQCLYK